MNHRVTADGGATGLLAAVLDISDDAVLGLDTEGRVTSCNRSAERIFGYPEADVVGQDLVTLFPPHLRPDVAVVVKTVSAGDRVEHFATEIQRPDGMLSSIWLSAGPVLDDNGNPPASVVIARDITEQRLAQAALAEAETRVRDSEALAHIGGWMWDVRTGTVQWTDELHRIHGIDPRDFEGTLAAHLSAVHSGDRDRVRAALEDSVASGRRFAEQYRVVRPGGEVRVLYARAAPTLGSAGTVLGLRGVTEDVSGRPSTSTSVAGEEVPDPGHHV